MKNLLTITTLYFLLSMSQALSLPPCEGAVWNNCIGTTTDDEGNIYVGEYKNNQRHGQGTGTFVVGIPYLSHHLIVLMNLLPSHYFLPKKG